MLGIFATLSVHNVTHGFADRAGLARQHILDLGIREGQPGFPAHLLPDVINAANHAQFQAVGRIGHRDGVVDAHEVHCPTSEIHEEHGRLVLQQPGFGHKGGVALREDSDFPDGDAVLHALKSEMHRLPGTEQVISKLRLVAPEAGQRQSRRDPYRTFGWQSAHLNLLCDGRQRQQIIVVVRSLIPLDRLPPGATNKKAPANL